MIEKPASHHEEEFKQEKKPMTAFSKVASKMLSKRKIKKNPIHPAGNTSLAHVSKL